MLRGSTDLPLHYGKSPRWLFRRMVELAREITEIIVDEYGNKTFLERISDPYWFQSFACVLGFDWHSSGTTTVTLGALKEAIKSSELKEEIFIAGGKGSASRKVPNEIEEFCKRINLSDRKIEELVKSSRLSAKVDNSALQDGFQLYHHSFIFTKDARWTVIQQGMNEKTGYARRYHWLSDRLESFKDFVSEPHKAIVCDVRVKALNMTAKEAEEARKASVDLVKDPVHLERELQEISGKKTLLHFSMPREHFPKIKENLKVNFKALKQAYEEQPKSYEELLMIKGIGKETIKALALISNLVYGSRLSWKDPCKYAFAHGGKDGWPYPVNKRRYDKSIEILRDAIKNAKLGRKEKLQALKRLKDFIEI